MWTFYEKNKQAIHDIVLLLAAVLGCCLFFRYLFRIFLPFLIGWLLSLLFNPLADRLQKFHIPRGISAIIGILLLFALLGLLGFWSGTGLIAKHIVRSADHIEATDASQEMIEQAKQGVKSAKLYFSVQDMFHLPYADQSFDVVIVVNALHIVPEPEKALSEIRRVLKDDGVLVAPTFTHADNAFFGKVKAFFMKLAGFPLHSKWTSADYLSFLRENGWTVRKSTVLKASFPLTYAECVKSEG